MSKNQKLADEWESTQPVPTSLSDQNGDIINHEDKLYPLEIAKKHLKKRLMKTFLGSMIQSS